MKGEEKEVGNRGNQRGNKKKGKWENEKKNTFFIYNICIFTIEYCIQCLSHET